MKNDVDESSADAMPSLDGPARAKDMFGLTGGIVQNLIDNQCFDELLRLYGILPAEASKSLHYADLATLPAWDADLLSRLQA